MEWNVINDRAKIGDYLVRLLQYMLIMGIRDFSEEFELPGSLKGDLRLKMIGDKVDISAFINSGYAEKLYIDNGLGISIVLEDSAKIDNLILNGYDRLHSIKTWSFQGNINTVHLIDNNIEGLRVSDLEFSTELYQLLGESGKIKIYYDLNEYKKTIYMLNLDVPVRKMLIREIGEGLRENDVNTIELKNGMLYIKDHFNKILTLRKINGVSDTLRQSIINLIDEGILRKFSIYSEYDIETVQYQGDALCSLKI